MEQHTNQTSHYRLCGRGFPRKQPGVSGASRDIELRLARVKTSVKELLQRDGIIDRLGESRVYGSVYEAVAGKIPDEPTVP